VIVSSCHVTMEDDTKEFVPNWASSPGDSIREAVDHRRMARLDFQAAMGFDPDELRDLYRGALRITPEIARRLSDVVGGSQVFWLRREAQYLDSLARLAWKDVESVGGPVD